MDNRKKLEDLRVYIQAFEFSNLIWSICSEWNLFAKKTIGEQMVRSADSMSANIAEGYGRFHYKENLKFCYYARGSFEETRDWIKKADFRNLIPEDHKNQLQQFMESYPKSLNAYIKYIRKCMETK
ncbi:MAG: four helix bundle protein [bacterium]